MNSHLDDIELIEAYYAKMGDEELKQFAHSEANLISDDAIKALFREFKKRDLDTECFKSIISQRLDQKRQQVADTLAQQEKEFARAVWNFAFDEKIAGKSDPEIIDGLLNMGVSDIQTLEIVSSLRDQAKRMYDGFEREQRISGGIFVLGVILFLMLFVDGVRHFNVYYIVLLSTGGVRLFKVSKEVNRYKNVLIAFEEEDKEIATPPPPPNSYLT